MEQTAAHQSARQVRGVSDLVDHGGHLIHQLPHLGRDVLHACHAAVDTRKFCKERRDAEVWPQPQHQVQHHRDQNQLQPPAKIAKTGGYRIDHAQTAPAMPYGDRFGGRRSNFVISTYAAPFSKLQTLTTASNQR